ncbi:MAG: Gfo/Idh/MocA family oxidoreductase [Dysgonamonadaceae bacterium]|nr:Gfo/Idh/MocA family oxidoreductase [Dysgonamonadaceae bacterium]MDD4727414.1 Gfo/Idh/MocA family oxidoreductase [Dysgonamonadaceae bacterium]
MKKSILNSILLILALSFVSCGVKHSQKAPSELSNINYGSSRPVAQKNVLKLTANPIPTVRIGFIGVGNRGGSAVRRYTFMKGVEIVALCDLNGSSVTKSQDVLKSKGLSAATEYVGENTWKEVCERDDIDLVYICTDWGTHVPMAVYAMEQGKHVAIEVPAATSVDECWQLVDTAEKTRKHCTILENCCYDFFELNTLNMAQNGLFGELVHAEGAYIHDLRTQFKSNGWRIKYYEEYTGNPYPTHGFGPICQSMNIHRGDKMNYLVSVSSNQFGITNYLKDTFGEDSSEAKRLYKLGDMNTTIIKTEKGKTMIVQHDVTSPRPYSRLHTLSGTKGFAQKYPDPKIALEPNSHEFLSEEEFNKLMKEYEHPFIKEIGEYAKSVGGHGGMDFIMDYRLIYCLRNGLPLDIDVYDAAEWSCLFELTELSASNGGMPIRIPDFTRGDWNQLNGLKFAE